MAGVPQKTLSWLYDVLRREYRDPNRAYTDLAQALAQYPGFAPRTDVFTSENGQSALLLNLKGTVPVSFRGTIYRFPIALWMPHAYPYEAPVVYVTPTVDMVVRHGQHVSSADGKVYHHYLSQWSQARDRSNVLELLRILADIFGKEPPVMAKPPPGVLYEHAHTQHIPSGSQPRNQGQNRYSQSQGIPTPPPPPKQYGTAAPDLRSSSTAPPIPAPRPGRYDAPPPLPPPAGDARPQTGYANGHQPRPVSAQYPPQSPTSPVNQQPLGQPVSLQNRMQTPGGQMPGLQPQAYPQQYQQQRPIPGQTQQYPQTSQLQHPSYNQPPPQQLTPKPKPAPPKDLLSEEDPFQLTLPSATSSQHTDPSLPAPPIPTNPEKTALLTHISHLVNQQVQASVSQIHTTALPPLQTQHIALTTAHQTLTSELSHLQSLSAHLSSNISSLQSTIAAATKTIAATSDPSSPLNPSQIPQIEEIIIPPSVVARQLYDNVAEQRGYEAAIYALNEGFVRGRIGAEVWGRRCREMAREEFRRKWMVKRIGTGLGLEGAG